MHGNEKKVEARGDGNELGAVAFVVVVVGR